MENTLPLIENDQQKQEVKYWLWVAISALGLAGLFSIVLVIARTPGLSEIAYFNHLFSSALVAHVDLSVLVWFLSITCLLFSWNAGAGKDTKAITIPYLKEGALLCYAGATLCIALSPLHESADIFKSNYIPVINSPVFFIGLALLLCGTAFAILAFLTAPRQKNTVYYHGLMATALVTLAAIIAFFWSFYRMPSVLNGELYFEVLFWGGGHLLQFTYTHGMMLAWLLLIAALWPYQRIETVWMRLLFLPGIVAALTSVYPYFHYPVDSVAFRSFFTQQMIWLGSIGPACLLFWIVYIYRQNRPELAGKRAIANALLSSAVLFVAGGMLGVAIDGQDVTIPAHYHGAIVAVTLALMGLVYIFLPALGYRPVAHWRSAKIQPIMYGVGQLMHIGGLAWSGGYGVLRKTPGALEGGFTQAKAAMALMGTGGMLAIMGGLLFVIIVIKSTRGSATS